MIWFGIVIAIALAVVAVYWMRPGSAARTRRGPFKASVRERDPVCGMAVEVSHAKGRRDHDGRVFWFCSVACTDKFDANPDAYSGGDSAPLAQKVVHHAP